MEAPGSSRRPDRPSEPRSPAAERGNEIRRSKRKPGESSYGSFVRQPVAMQPPEPSVAGVGSPSAGSGPRSGFRALPSVLHFGGFHVGETSTTTVKILNVSSRSRHVLIFEPSTPFFSISYDKIGSIAPGVAQSITVIFKPTEHRYVALNPDCRGDDESKPRSHSPSLVLG